MKPSDYPYAEQYSKSGSCSRSRAAAVLRWEFPADDQFHDLGNLLSENRKLRQALNRLHVAAGKRMMVDDPTADERIEFMEAWKAAGEILSANDREETPTDD